MKKWILIIISLSLVVLSIRYYPLIRFMVAEKPEEPIMVSDVNILSKLKEAAKEQETLNYLVLGDSVARGFGSEKTGPHGYSSLVVKGLGQDEISLNLVNKGVVGQTSTKLRNYIQKKDIRESIANADLISLTIGGNDLLKVALKENNPLRVISDFNRIQAQYKENLSGILKEIRSLNHEAPILITSLYNPVSKGEPFYRISNHLLNQWNVGLKQMAYGYSLTLVVDVADRLPAGSRNWLSDQIHPNDRGYRLIADGILDEIRSSRPTSASAR
ncbi:lysophospholipase L1-like esterase [Melghirimyces profundicolus]|uniref:Lysophospholipase L1-like esterase n=1 Tax=Melghirimyces profundicolus TaxID=1242148 RepID=A0A2T6C990_9BACL|nr:GDSL-type esterase/lipase family protein [Melghirimyces profundicolus]PTX64890.1 lysophospholipase L1-like esterase [Melghirimyces profundicolus]